MKLAPRCLIMPIALGIFLASPAGAQNDTMSTILEKLGARVQKFENACGDEIKRFCQTVTPGGGRMINCMQAHDDKISPACSFELSELEVDLQEVDDQLKQAVRICQGDISKLCDKTQPGQGRLAACLNANRSSVSRGCVEAIEKIQVK
jgi:hypothetical protein